MVQHRCRTSLVPIPIFVLSYLNLAMADWFSAGMSDDTSKVQRMDDDDDDGGGGMYNFRSRRSPVLSRHGCVTSSQPLATSIGVDFLRRGANAADASIAVAAALCVTEPCSTGLGGDMFCLYYDADSRHVHCINGSGYSPAGLSLDVIKRDCLNDETGQINYEKFQFSPHSVTVPGAAMGYEDLLKKHGSGKFTLEELLEPAAALAEEGFPVAPVTSHFWRKGINQIKVWVEDGNPVPLTMDGKNGPMPGNVFQNKDLARVLRDLGRNGAKKGFYEGHAGKAIVKVLEKHGGTMSMEDLMYQSSSYPDPISVEYRDVRLWQVPPNGQGIAGLIALRGLQQLEDHGRTTPISPSSIGGADSYHVMIEMMRLGFFDARKYVADEDHLTVSSEWLLDPKRIGDRARKEYDPSKATVSGMPESSSCTVSFQVVDGEGNAISFVNSNFMGFGTGIVPDGCGFTLQNRGAGFSLDDDDDDDDDTGTGTRHPNAVGPRKRPYHTIIPGMVTYSDTNELHSTISNMGGNMQPQGHLQLTVGMVAGGLDPQAAIDFPRFCIADGTKDGIVMLESGVDQATVDELHRRGHKLRDSTAGYDRSIFGRAQIIKRDRTTGVLWAGSDGRADGCAMGF